MTTPCANCGTPLPENANFCPKCGAATGLQSAPAPSKGMPSWLIVLLIVAAVCFLALPVFGLVAAILIPNFIHARAESTLVADENNLKTIAAALERYAVDHNGTYPDNLPQLVPTYLAKLPVVPGGDNTGAYDYHHPATLQSGGSYEVWDDGSMDSTTMGLLPRGANGPPCDQGCKYVVYIAGVGVVGVAGQR
ncbi:MAG TPA: zinc-ribbon domain-containing protein [Candidatus Eremiobacteraceae bacterium]|nr:zinc-ribbon domain-containing protein [Candidatus Eremiobacteraceae bacterium]